MKQYYIDNKARILKQHKAKSVELSAYNKKYWQNNKERLTPLNTEYQRAHKEQKRISDKKYYETHKIELNQRAKIYAVKKRNIDPIARLKHCLRTRLGYAIKRIGLEKNINTTTLLGADWLKIKKHIEDQFTSDMTWDKMGKKIHIDHITPLSSAINNEELKSLFHYTNLQPLWAEDNLTKGAKLSY